MIRYLSLLVFLMACPAYAQSVKFVSAGFNDANHKILGTTIEPPGEFVTRINGVQTPLRLLGSNDSSSTSGFLNPSHIQEIIPRPNMVPPHPVPFKWPIPQLEPTSYPPYPPVINLTVSPTLIIPDSRLANITFRSITVTIPSQPISK